MSKNEKFSIESKCSVVARRGPTLRRFVRVEVGLSKKGSEEVRPMWRLNPKKLLEKGSEEADKRNIPSLV